MEAIGAGLAVIGMAGAALGIGILAKGAMEGIARQPEAAGIIRTTMIIAIAFAEALGILSFVIAITLAGKV